MGRSGYRFKLAAATARPFFMDLFSGTLIEKYIFLSAETC
jgi:hypothetical protein